MLAGLLAIVTIPVHPVTSPSIGPMWTEPASGEALHAPSFWLLTGAFVAQAVAAVLLVAALGEAGHVAAVAALLSGLLGVMSVTGRLITTRAARRIGMTTVTAAVFAIQPAALHHGMTVDAISDLDLSYTPPLGSPYDAVQIAAHAWALAQR